MPSTVDVTPPPGRCMVPRLLRHLLADGAARIARLALSDVPSAGAPGGCGVQAGRGGRVAGHSPGSAVPWPPPSRRLHRGRGTA
jgi:hypothetical protein